MAYPDTPGHFAPAAVRGGLAWAARKLDQLRCLVPGACPLCGVRVAGASLCAACDGFLLASMATGTPRCDRCCLCLDSRGLCADCTGHTVQFDRVLAVFDYADPGDLLVRQYKHLCRFGMAPMLARLLSRALDQAVVPLAAPDCVVPVPSHPSMLRQRGFSPAAQLAVHLCHLRGWHAHLGVLARRTHTGLPQKALGRLQRAQQAQGMYHCTRSVNGLSVLVVDDVMTTGSTLNAVAEALLHAGAVSVNGLVLARTPAHQARARRLPGR